MPGKPWVTRSGVLAVRQWADSQQVQLKSPSLAGLTGLAVLALAIVLGLPAAAADQTRPDVERPVSQARAHDDSCPAEWGLPQRFADVPESSAHAAAIACAAHWRITQGASPDAYAPARPVTRAQMASFIVRVVEYTGGMLADRPGDHFTDDDGTLQHKDIDRLAEAGIVVGKAPGRFEPQATVTRAQMAVFLTRAYDFRAAEEGQPLLPRGGDHFADDDTSPLRPEIDKAAAAGFAGGYGDGTYRPGEEVRRDQMASFLTRVLDLLVETGITVAPAAPQVAPPPQPRPEGPPPPYSPPTKNVVELVSCTRYADGSFHVEVHHTIAGGAWELPATGYADASPHWNGEPLSARRGLIALSRPNPDEPITLSAMVLRTITIGAPGGGEPARVVITPPPDFVVQPAQCVAQTAPS